MFMYACVHADSWASDFDSVAQVFFFFFLYILQEECVNPFLSNVYHSFFKVKNCNQCIYIKIN
jgi:hypothetical protein